MSSTVDDGSPTERTEDDLQCFFAINDYVAFKRMSNQHITVIKKPVTVTGKSLNLQ